MTSGHLFGMFSLPAVGKTTTGSPVELEQTVGVGHGGAVQGQSLGGGGRGREVDEAVTGVAPTTNIRIAFILNPV